MSGNYRVLADSGCTMYSRKEFEEEPSSLLHNSLQKRSSCFDKLVVTTGDNSNTIYNVEDIAYASYTNQ